MLLAISGENMMSNLRLRSASPSVNVVGGACLLSWKSLHYLSSCTDLNKSKRRLSDTPAVKPGYLEGGASGRLPRIMDLEVPAQSNRWWEEMPTSSELHLTDVELFSLLKDIQWCYCQCRGLISACYWRKMDKRENALKSSKHYGNVPLIYSHTPKLFFFFYKIKTRRSSLPNLWFYEKQTVWNTNEHVDPLWYLLSS